jgi:peptide/nickel transport system permease protein
MQARRAGRARSIGAAVLLAFATAAVGADCLASDRPLALEIDGDICLLPNLFSCTAIGEARGVRISAALRHGDWALWPPVRHHPEAVRTAGELEILAPPSRRHWLGTDDRGRDVLARLIHGARSSLRLAAIVAFGALGLGLVLAAAGLAGSRAAAAAVAAVADLGAGLPVILLVVAAQGLLGLSLAAAALVLIAPRAADTARIAGAALGRALSSDYAAAARALGVGRAGLLWRHALPNAAPQLVAATAVTASTAVLAEIALSFLGFGTPPPAASWGELLAQALAHRDAWWLLWPPGLCVAALAAALAFGRQSPGR